MRSTLIRAWNSLDSIELQRNTIDTVADNPKSKNTFERYLASHSFSDKQSYILYLRINFIRIRDFGSTIDIVLG